MSLVSSLIATFLLTILIVFGTAIEILSLFFSHTLEKTCVYLRDFPLGSDLQERLGSYVGQIERRLNDLRFQVGHLNAWLRLFFYPDHEKRESTALETRRNGSFGLHRHIIKLKNEIIIRDQIIETIQKVLRRICDRSISDYSFLSVYQGLLPKPIFDLILKFQQEQSRLVKEKHELQVAKEDIFASQLDLGRAREELKFQKTSWRLLDSL